MADGNNLNRKKVILYPGYDLPDLLIINKLVPQMINMGIEPVVLFARKPISKNPNAFLPDMKELGFYHNRLLQDTVIPFLDSKGPILDAVGKLKPDLCYTPQQLATYYGLELGHIEDVNSPEHIKRIKQDTNVIGAISVRCMQRFEQPIISALQEKGFVWNVHPGKLPDFRGVLPVFRAMHHGEPEIQWTLHSIEDRTLDTGARHSTTSQAVDLRRSVFYHYNTNACGVSAMVLGKLRDILQDRSISRFVQDIRKGHYYSYPSAKITKEFNEAGGTFVEPRKQMIAFFTRIFAGSRKGEIRNKFINIVCQAIEKETGQPTCTSTSRQNPARQSAKPLTAQLVIANN